MLSFIALLLLLIFIYRNYEYRKMDYTKLSHSSYYDLTYHKDRKCADEVYDCLKSLSGHKRFVYGYRFTEAEEEDMSADILMLHETGIYVIESKDYQGYISGTNEEQYWVQTPDVRQYNASRNFFYNPMIKNEECITALKKELYDMPWVPYCSMVVFGNGCDLGNSGLSGQRGRILTLNQLSYFMYDTVRSAHKFLAPQVIDEIYERISSGQRE